MAIAKGTCVSFCNQPKAHFGLPWVRPWDNRGKCYMDEKMIFDTIPACDGRQTDGQTSSLYQ